MMQTSSIFIFALGFSGTSQAYTSSSIWSPSPDQNYGFFCFLIGLWLPVCQGLLLALCSGLCFAVLGAEDGAWRNCTPHMLSAITPHTVSMVVFLMFFWDGPESPIHMRTSSDVPKGYEMSPYKADVFISFIHLVRRLVNHSEDIH